MAIPEIRQAVRHMRAGKTEEAISPLEKVVELMPEYVTAHVLLARMYEASDRHEKALQTWQFAFFLMPNSPVVIEGIHRVLRRASSAMSEEANPEGPLSRATASVLAAIDASQASELAEQGPASSSEATGTGAAQDNELDRLIEELESARIVPRLDLDDIPTPKLEDDIEDVVSETLARIYISQEQYGEAARVYDKLAIQQPESAERFRKKAAELRDRGGG